MLGIKRWTRALCGLGMVFSMSAHAAGDFPSQSVRLIVPFPPGGSVDIVARTYAQELQGILGQTVVVENRAGANGIIGANAVANAKPDGYTLLLASSGTFTISPALQKVPFDPFNSFDYLGLVVNYANVLLVNTESKYQSLGDLIAQARSQPGAVTFGSSGAGGSNHLGGELLAYQAKVKMLHVPYKGNAPAMTDLQGGRIDFMFDITTTAKGHIEGGKVRPLAITSAQRNPAFPNVPTTAEAGVAGVEFEGWFGLMAPAGLPQDVAQKLVSANQKIVGGAAFGQKLRDWGYSVPSTDPQVMRERVKADLDSVTTLVKNADIKAND